MTPPRAEPGLFDSLQRLAGTALANLHSRLALAGLELGEARERFLVTLVLAFAAVLLAGAAITALSVWLVLVLWPRTGPAAVLALAGLYALAAGALLWRLRVRARRAPELLGDTLRELKRDAQALRGSSRQS